MLTDQHKLPLKLKKKKSNLQALKKTKMARSTKSTHYMLRWNGGVTCIRSHPAASWPISVMGYMLYWRLSPRVRPSMSSILIPAIHSTHLPNTAPCCPNTPPNNSQLVQCDSWPLITFNYRHQQKKFESVPPGSYYRFHCSENFNCPKIPIIYLIEPRV